MPHTPTPWRAMRTRIAGQIHPSSDTVTRFVADTELDPTNARETEVDKANAALIVRAVNAHDALVAALEGMVERFQASSTFPALDAARAALKLAKGS